MAFGMVIGINSSQSSGGTIQAWSIGMAVVGVVIIAGTLIGPFNLSKIARALVPLLLLCLILIPLSQTPVAQVSFVAGCGSYVFSLVFYQVAYVAIAETQTMPSVSLVALATCVDSLGIIIGELLCLLASPFLQQHQEAVYLLTFGIAFALVITNALCLNDKSTASLWGFKRPLSQIEESLINQAHALSTDYGLTQREEAVLVELAKANEPSEIAKALGISITTVRSHVRNIYVKADVHSREELTKKLLDR